MHLLVAILFLTPFTTIFDSIFWTMNGWKTDIITPLYLSLLDDFLILVIFSILVSKFVIDLSSRDNLKKIMKFNMLKYCYFLLLLFIFISLFVSSFFSPALIILSGLRSVLFIFLIGLFLILNQHNFLNIQKRIVYILIIFIYINLSFQFLQIFAFVDYYGPTPLGLSQRTIGFLREPNALSLLNIFSFYFLFFYMKDSIHRKLLVFIFIPTSILLSGSITPMLGLFLVSLLYIFRFNLKLLFMVFPITFLLFYLIIPEITTRPGLINSLVVRLDIIINSLTIHNIFFSTNFGYGTNTASILTNSAFIPESTIASLLVNIGLFGTLVFYIFLFRLGFDSKKALIFVLLMVTASCTNIIFESSPVNILFAFELAYLLKNQIKYFESSNA